MELDFKAMAAATIKGTTIAVEDFMPTISSIAKPTSVTDAITAIAKSVVDAVA
jgi:hypothetical protein